MIDKLDMILKKVFEESGEDEIVEGDKKYKKRKWKKKEKKENKLLYLRVIFK